MDASHELCGRVMGAMFVASYAISANALHWKDQLDRAIAAEARVVVRYLFKGLSFGFESIAFVKSIHFSSSIAYFEATM